jgi:site-specific recombinase
VSEGFLAAYVRHGLQAAQQWQDAYDAAIAVAPDDDSRHLMVRFAEQCRVRVDVLERLLHQLGVAISVAKADTLPDIGEADAQVRWWRILHDLWTAECQAHQHLAVLRAVGETWGASVILRTVSDLEHSVDERLHVLQAMTRQAAPEILGRYQDLPTAA